jgi:hypothetical protein
MKAVALRVMTHYPLFIVHALVYNLRNLTRLYPENWRSPSLPLPQQDIQSQQHEQQERHESFQSSVLKWFRHQQQKAVLEV